MNGDFYKQFVHGMVTTKHVQVSLKGKANKYMFLKINILPALSQVD